VKGFLIGRPGAAFGEEMFGLDQYNAVTGILGEMGVPILFDLDIGHHPPMIPMLCGAMAKVNFADNKFKISYELR
jgi:muramoyltetrapeptide carboxypeptidase LdcA involved in peptidoglycan recycling